MKKTIVKISEGLGNQLFMYALNAYAFSLKWIMIYMLTLARHIKNLK